MSIDIRHSHPFVKRMLNRGARELMNGSYSEMDMVNLFEVWILRSDGEIDHVGSHVKYPHALESAELHVLAMEAGDVPEILEAMVIWVYRDGEEDSVLEVAIRKRKVENEKAGRLKLIDDQLDHVAELMKQRKRDNG